MSKSTASLHNEKRDELLLARYSSLVDMWAHHNTNQLLFPQVIISAVLIVLSLVLNDQPVGKLQRILDPALWGIAYDLQIGVGIPLFITGLSIAPMIYAMGRSRRIMQGIKTEVTKIEHELFGQNEDSFAILNHPRGASATVILRIFMVFALAVPVTAFGLLILLGTLPGIIVFGVLFVFWTVLDVSTTISVASTNFGKNRQWGYSKTKSSRKS